MSNRYEDYPFFADNIPFVLYQDVKRTAAEHDYNANWHENVELQLCTEGEGSVFIDGMKFPYTKNVVIAVNSGLTHFTETASTLRYTCIIIDSQFCRDAGINLAELKITPTISDKEVTHSIQQICACYNEIDQPTRTAKLRMYTLALVIRLCEAHAIREEPISHTGRRSGRQHGSGNSQNASREMVKAAINYMRDHFHEKITLDGIANALFVNKYTLSRQFKSIVGVTVFEYLSSYRCHRASLLIADGESIKSAALSSGFENISFFTKTFRRYMGKKPSEFKNK